MPFAPDIAVDIFSSEDRASDMNAKVQAYLEAGTPLVWVVDPERRTAAVYRPGAATLFLSEGDALDGGDVLPGFSMPLARVFED